MPLNLASPGIVVREVDLTVGRVDATNGGIGALVAPFAKGPVDSPVLVNDEAGLLQNFGEPYNTDKHYEHWMVASSYLAYGGNLQVVRADDDNLTNAFVGSATSIKVKSTEHYEQLGYDLNTITGVTFAARNPGSWANGLKVATIDAKADQILGGISTSATVAPNGIVAGYGVTQAISATLPGEGTTTTLDGYLRGIVTEVDGTDVYVKVLDHVSAAGTVTEVDYQLGGVYAFSASGSVGFSTSGDALGTAGAGTTTYTTQKDWFDQQSITLDSGNVSWNTLADRPGTSSYASSRDSRFDEIHVVVIDDKGTVSGNAGTILEKHVSLSKATDAEYSLGSTAYWRKYIANGSVNVFGGDAPAGLTTTGFSSGNVPVAEAAGDWDQDTDGVTFAASGNQTYTLAGGKNYDDTDDITASGALTSTLGKLSSGYSLFENTDNYDIDFLLMGSANYSKENAQALANKLIAVAEVRQDALAFISPYRLAFLNDSVVGSVTVNSDADITDNVLSFYAPITSSSYAVFDSGYKYAYDRFSDTFRYVPLNGDIAGLCARNDLNNFPWF